MICALLKSGRRDEIPAGYNIVWVGAGEPRKLLNERIDGKRVTFLRNPIGGLEYLEVTGDVTVVMAPAESCDDYLGKFFEPLEYGDVYVKTGFDITDITMRFKKGWKGNPAMPAEEWAKWVAGSVECFIPKASITFDISAKCGDGRFEIYNLLLTQWTDMGNKGLRMEFVCDYFITKQDRACRKNA